MAMWTAVTFGAVHVVKESCSYRWRRFNLDIIFDVDGHLSSAAFEASGAISFDLWPS